MLFSAKKRKAKRLSAERQILQKPAIKYQKGFGTEMPPQKALVEIYFDQKGSCTQGVPFFDHYDKANWCSPKGTPYRNWKLLASDWIFNYEQEQKLRKRQRANMLTS